MKYNRNATYLIQHTTHVIVPISTLIVSSNDFVATYIFIGALLDKCNAKNEYDPLCNETKAGFSHEIYAYHVIILQQLSLLQFERR